MNGVFHPRLDILPQAQRELWPGLAPLVAAGYVLHGGTAIALRLGHRASIDFDFFSDMPLNRRLLSASLAFLDDCVTTQDEPDSLTVVYRKDEGRDPVKLSFIGNIRFGRVGVPDLTDDGVALVASLDDLLAQKLKVVMQRIESKDYRDVAAILRGGVSLSNGMACAMKLFGPAFAPAECARALVYFKGGDLAFLGESDRSILIEGVRNLDLAQFANPHE
jgi:hypothetical protein